MMRLLFLILCINLASCSHNAKLDPAVISKLSSISLDIDQDSIPSYEFKRRFTEIANTDYKNLNYILKISFRESKRGLIMQKDAEPIRQNIDLKVYYNLSEKYSGKQITSGNFRIINSYNTLFSPYSTNLEEEQANINSYLSAAEEIRRKLILYFISSNS